MKEVRRSPIIIFQKSSTVLDSYLKIESQGGGEKILVVEKAAVFNAISHINTPVLLSRVFFVPWFDLFKAIYFLDMV